jgi:hypothetical protein
MGRTLSAGDDKLYGMKTLLLAAALALLVCSTAFAATRSARVGDTVTVKAHGLETGRYALTLVADERPTRNSFCVRRLTDRKRTRGGRVTLSGEIPRRIVCYEGNGSRLGSVKVTPGRYHLIVSVPDGPTGSDARYSFLRRALRIVK